MSMEDPAAEKAVLAGCAQSSDAFLDVDYLLGPSTFTDEVNQVVWKCIKSLRDEQLDINIDISLLKSKAKHLGFGHVFEDPSEFKYLKSLLSFSIEFSNVKRYAGIIRRLEVARLLEQQLEDAQIEIRGVNGTEGVDAIIAMAENRIFDLSSLLNDKNKSEITHISDGALEYYEYLLNNETDIIGIPTGFSIWDSFLGGLRRRTISLIGARTNVGKSMLADTIALHIAGKINVPVLYLDTEMELDGHWHRIWGNVSSVPSKEIETGKFGKNELKTRAVKDAVDYVNGIPYYYVNISGKPFEETLSYIRRWLIKNVGVDENGKMKDCVVIYDYLKLMSSAGMSNDMKEYQIMGFQMTGLHNFAVKYDIPILSFVQLNRDGIDKETTDAVSQSDRIVWLTSNLSIYKPKSDEEMSTSGENGNMKMIVVKNRYGQLNSHNEYINFQFDGSVARVTERELSSKVKAPMKIKLKKKKDFEVEEDDNEPVNFNA